MKNNFDILIRKKGFACQDNGVSEIKSYKVGAIALLVIVLLIAFTGMVYADSGVNATPEVQGLITSTSSSVQGTVTETDSGAWTTTYDPPTITPGTPDLIHIILIPTILIHMVHYVT